ncbi:MAG: transglutaminase family protein [Alphaproteobacteria bacterium]|nr:transglutaminase family protein [Alphaproteobacteria bacterium]
MHSRIRHLSRYRYGEPVASGHHLLRLRPRPLPHQNLRHGELAIDPKPSQRRIHQDYFGNPIDYALQIEPHDHLTVTTTLEVEVGDRPEVAAEMTWESAVAWHEGAIDSARLACGEFRLDSRLAPRHAAIVDYVRHSFIADRPLGEALDDLLARVHADFAYAPGTTHVATTVGEVLARRQGVCQDFAHLVIAGLRGLGFAARYVSGYLHPGPGLSGADASHAWVAVYVPGQGWLEIDPTNRCRAGQGHVTLCYGRDYSDIAPIQGVLVGGGKHSLEVKVDFIDLK